MSKVKLNTSPFDYDNLFHYDKYCKFCGHLWGNNHSGSRREDCISVVPRWIMRDSTTYDCYRTDSCYLREIENLKNDLLDAEKQKQAVLDKAAAFRKALKEFIL